MSDDPDLWPDELTLAAGDERLRVEPFAYDPMSDDEDRVSPSGLPIINARPKLEASE